MSAYEHQKRARMTPAELAAYDRHNSKVGGIVILVILAIIGGITTIAVVRDHPAAADYCHQQWNSAAGLNYRFSIDGQASSDVEKSFLAQCHANVKFTQND